MQRFSTWAMVSITLTLLMSSMGWGQETSTAQKLLPKTTKGVLLISNAQDLSKHWEETQWGQLMRDPVMEPFAKDLRRQLQDRLSRVRERLGLRLEDLRDVPGGELAVAMIQPAKDQAALVLLVDVTGHLPQAKAMLEKVTANLTQQGAKQTKQTVEKTTLIVFDVPETQDFPAGKAVYFLSGNLLVAADHQDVMEGILKRKLGQATPEGSLADLPAFKSVMERCHKHAKDAVPQIRWFLEPLGYVEAIRAATPQENRRKGVTVVDVLREQGFSAVQGVGGYVDLKVDGYEVLHRTVIYAPRPYKAAPAPYKNKVSMDILSLSNRQEFTPPAWIPNDVAACATLYWDVLKAFDNLGPTFDQVVGEGKQTGILDDVLNDLKEDPNGPEIDLRAELFAHLGQRVTLATDYVLPITPTSERLLFAIEVRNEAAVAAGIKKMFKDDPTMKRREFEKLEIWEMVEEPSQHALPDDPLVDLPSLAPKKKETSRPGRKLVSEEEEEETQWLPHKVFTVVNGHLVIASHYEYLVEVLTKAKKPDPVSQSPDFRVVEAEMKKLGADKNCIRSFSRTDEAYRSTYELIRMGKMPQSETMLGRVLNTLLGPHKKGAVREQQVDGRQMPDYEMVRRYLGPAGLFGAAEDDGWFLVGFTLKK